MKLPVMPPVKPMLATAVSWDGLGKVAPANSCALEPKWDGFWR